jgi:hypothetical protein
MGIEQLRYVSGTAEMSSDGLDQIDPLDLMDREYAVKRRG